MFYKEVGTALWLTPGRSQWPSLPECPRRRAPRHRTNCTGALFEPGLAYESEKHGKEL